MCEEAAAQKKAIEKGETMATQAKAGSAWGKSSGNAICLNDIMAEEEAAQRSANSDENEELNRAIAASLAQEREDRVATTDDESLSLALALSLQDEEADSSIALALQLEEQAKGMRQEAQRSAERRAAAARHERVRLVSRLDECESLPRNESTEEDGFVGGIEELFEREGIEPDSSLGRGIIGRRTKTGELVSKHDAALDSRLKAQILQDSSHINAGDIQDERVPGRVFNDLLRKSGDRQLVAPSNKKRWTPTKGHAPPSL